jgi:hypothetical protein
MAEMSEQLLIAEVERRRTDKHPDIPSDQVSVVIQTVCAQFERSPIRDFVPLLVERRASAELAKLTQAVPASL